MTLGWTVYQSYVYIHIHIYNIHIELHRNMIGANKCLPSGAVCSSRSSSKGCCCWAKARPQNSQGKRSLHFWNLYAIPTGIEWTCPLSFADFHLAISCADVPNWRKSTHSGPVLWCFSCTQDTLLRKINSGNQTWKITIYQFSHIFIYTLYTYSSIIYYYI